MAENFDTVRKQLLKAARASLFDMVDEGLIPQWGSDQTSFDVISELIGYRIDGWQDVHDFMIPALEALCGEHRYAIYKMLEARTK